MEGNGFKKSVNIKEANKQVKIYVGRSLILQVFCVLFIDSAMFLLVSFIG